MDGDGRGQSEVTGVLLLTGVMIVLTVAVSAVMFANFDAQYSQNPSVDMNISATVDNVTISHGGGDSLDVADIDIVLRGNDSERYALGSFTQVLGSDSDRFTPGSEWTRTHNITADSMEVLLVHTQSDTILDRETTELKRTGQFFEVEITGTNSPVEVGETLEVNAEVDNTGIATGTQTIEFKFNGTTVATNTTTLDSGEGEPFEFTYVTTGETPDAYPVRVASDNRSAKETIRITEQLADINITSVDGLENDTETYDYSASVNVTESAGITTDNLTVAIVIENSTETPKFDETKSADTDPFSDIAGGTRTVDGFNVGTLTADDYEYFVSASANNAYTDGDRGTFTVTTVNSTPSVSITSSSISATGGSGKYDVSVTFEATDPDNDIRNYTVSLYNSSSETTLLDNASSNSYDGSSTTVSLSDSSSSNGESPLYVLVEVGDSTNRVGNDSVTLSANNDPPSASFSYSPTNPNTGETITFDASGSSDPNGDSLTYEWDFDDGTTTTTSSQTTTHSYSSSGNYDVKLTVKDGNGGIDSTTQTLSVTSPSNSPPSINKNQTTDTSQTGGQTKFARFNVDWNVSDDNQLSNLQLTMTRVSNGNQVDSASPSVSGTTASGNTTLRGPDQNSNPKNQEYDIKISVTDDEGVTTSKTIRVIVS